MAGCAPTRHVGPRSEAKNTSSRHGRKRVGSTIAWASARTGSSVGEAIAVAAGRLDDTGKKSGSAPRLLLTAAADRENRRCGVLGRAPRLGRLRLDDDTVSRATDLAR